MCAGLACLALKKLHNGVARFPFIVLLAGNMSITHFVPRFATSLLAVPNDLEWIL